MKQPKEEFNIKQFNTGPGILTSKKEMDRKSDSAKIFGCIERLARNGIVAAGSGHSISMADLIQTQLKLLGVESNVVEVSLTIAYTDKDPISFTNVGFDGNPNFGNPDTHVVVITQTEVPILIDASIAQSLPFGKVALVEEVKVIPATKQEPIEFDFPEENLKFVYKEKTSQRVPLTHQTSILQRIETDQKIFKGLSWLRLLIIIALTISTLNAGRGLYDFYQVYIHKNYWGPDTSEQMFKKLEQIEKDISQLKKK